jgi:phosphoribosylaminoimidazole-succinocarboxamide synthase
MADNDTVLINSDLPLSVFVKGKVRDTYDLGKQLLIVATDRLSAFDVVLPCGIPDKGRVLNQISAYWFNETKKLVPNHVIELVDTPKVLAKYLPSNKRFAYPAYLAGRSMVVKK